ncbi:hypothetical protein [Nonomuraea jiangxiensis]|uniref:Uncharacterized protein n=1 Tax=Nonomuraea jiangxiensis TaxID=633440 RepID=A0A1G7YUA8_9ACTN|nr:hypothetical protein [Nonomuraea jiangxiensis]SDG99836.1 hypothetical protein SAMN05421869_101211 [Nonomuraea jiangxiensis]
MRTPRLALVLLAAGAALMTGSAAFADPGPATEPTALELRVVVDDCPYKAAQP